MTFDEAVREYQLRSSIGPLVQGMKLSPFVNVPQQEYDRVKFLNNLFYETINKLRKEYAPTVEMTKRQARVFKLYYDSEKPFDKSEFECIDNYFMKSINKKDLMRAWLHPEIIKVVDE